MLSTIYSAKRHGEEGFTLLELLIVVIIIGILAAIALPIFLNQQRAAVDASVQSDVRNSVAQLTGAQATNNATFTPALSRAGTKLALVDETDGTKTKTVTTGATDTTLPTPAASDDFTLSGSNTGGGKFQGAGDDANGNTFTYTATTGKFTTGKAAAVASDYTAASGTYSNDGTTMRYTVDTFANSAFASGFGVRLYNPYSGTVDNRVSAVKNVQQMVVGSTDPKLPVATFTCPPYHDYADFNDLYADIGYTSNKYELTQSFDITDVKVYDAAGKAVPFEQDASNPSKLYVQVTCPYSVNAGPNGYAQPAAGYHLLVAAKTYAQQNTIADTGKRFEFTYANKAHTFKLP